MRILVCVKQVPDTSLVRIDPVKNTLIREGVPSIVNPYDTYALELAGCLRERHGGSISAVSMGASHAISALRDCIAGGADNATLVCDDAFAGSDTLATGYILSAAVFALEAKEGVFDLILCGKQAVDGDTGQVGPQLAENLGRALITCASNVEIAGAQFLIRQINDCGYASITCTKPAVVTVGRISREPRIPSLKSIAAATRAEIPVLSAKDLQIDLSRCGLSGSPTRVVAVHVPKRRCRGVKVSADHLSTAVDGFLALLDANNL